jgi:putative ABC transport system permease protein
MFRNYLKIAYRHIELSKLYSGINVLGLATGVTCMMMALLYWADEKSFDRFHENNPNLYRITTSLKEQKGGDKITLGGTGQVQGAAFKAAVPEVKDYVRVLGGDIYNVVSSDQKNLRLSSFFVDKNFFEIFSFRLISGNSKTVLSGVNAVVLTESAAKRFFNSTDVVGKQLYMEADPSFQRLKKPMVVTGVVADPPPNSSMQFEALFPFEFLQLSFVDDAWLNAYLGTFVLLHPQANISLVKSKFNKVFATQAKVQLAETMKNYGYSPEISYGLQTMTDIHHQPYLPPNSNAEGGINKTSSPFYAYMFLGIALFILLMAAINFVNITVVNSLKRAKEVGVRKISGGDKTQIVMQFLVESALLCCFAFLLSLIFLNIGLPLFNQLADKQFNYSNITQPQLWLYFLLLFAIIILMAGLYPAYILSNFRPSQVLYNVRNLKENFWLGKSLIVFQFALAVMLLIATFVYYGQMSYISKKELGYNPNQILKTTIEGAIDYENITRILKGKFAQEPAIKMATFASEGNVDFVKTNKTGFETVQKTIDENYLKALQIPLLVGRNFSANFKTDHAEAVIVNEAFVKASQLTNPIGAPLIFNNAYDGKPKTIIGVVKNFHFSSLREPIKPMAMMMNETQAGVIWLKIEKANQRKALASLERIFKETMPKVVFQYQFLDDFNAKQYSQELRWQKMINIATFLSFLICCLGLFGLSHLAIHQRAKEIGIRKVLGATVLNICTLISKDFLKLVCLAIIFASPVAYYIMNTWLQSFAYRIDITWPIFLIATIVAMAVALLTVSYQSIKAALMNPVKSLKSE